MQHTETNPIVTITNDLGAIDHMRRSLFEEHYRPFGWWITEKPGRQPIPGTIPAEPNATVIAETAVIVKQAWDEHDAYLALAAAVTNHLEDLGENATTQAQEDRVEGLRAEFDTLLDAGDNLTAFAKELDLDIEDPDVNVDYAEVDSSMYAGGTDGAR